MNNRTSAISPSFFLLLWGLAAAGLIMPGCDKSPSQLPEKRYNVVILVADALRQDAVGCYGGPARTPNIDWLAQHGVRFANAYSTAPWTSPSSVSMFTGNYATSYGFNVARSTPRKSQQQDTEYIDLPRIFVPADELLLAEVLKSFGYITGEHVENPNASLHNNLQGFDRIPQSPPSDQVAGLVNQITGGRLADSWDTEAYQSSLSFLSYLLPMEPGDRFCLLHWLLDPHAPFDPPKKFADRIQFDDSQLPVPRNYYSKTKYDRAKRSIPEQAFIQRLYVAEIESVDERVGFVISMLKHLNRLDDTYIIFTSDHGEQFGEHGLHGHGGHGLGCHYYEGLVRVPLIIFGPGLPAGSSVDSHVSLLDLAPTLKDLLGVEYAHDMQGRSWAPLMFDGAAREGHLYLDDIQDHEQIDALIENHYKLITLKNGRHELYELASDPRESNNFAIRTPGRTRTMMEKITRMRDENALRRKQNMERLAENVDQMPAGDRQKLIEKLKSLGYIN